MMSEKSAYFSYFIGFQLFESIFHDPSSTQRNEIAEPQISNHLKV